MSKSIVSDHAKIARYINHKKYHLRKWKQSIYLVQIIVAINMPENQAFNLDENKLFMPNSVTVFPLQASSLKL